ncbi:MAG: hypothetical protein QXN68_05185 [Thermoplasmata archaeon]
MIKSDSLIDLLLSFSKKDRVYILKGVLIQLTESERVSIYEKIVHSFSNSEKKKHFQIISSSLISRTRWKHINRWMESVFMNHYEYTPYKVAMMAMNYYRINRKMKPLMIAHARRVKKRVYYRLKVKSLK